MKLVLSGPLNDALWCTTDTAQWLGYETINNYFTQINLILDATE